MTREILTLRMLSKIFSRRHFVCFLLFPENSHCHFMQIDNLLQMSKPFFLRKKEKKKYQFVVRWISTLSGALRMRILLSFLGLKTFNSVIISQCQSITIKCCCCCFNIFNMSLGKTFICKAERMNVKQRWPRWDSSSGHLIWIYVVCKSLLLSPVCLCWGFTAQSTHGVISSAVSLPNHTFTWQA